ncbi:hypothetical protein [Christensenella massiliensis]|uniref:Uncharacterized protein n=1 Tax=Christensenella massiliensis TaxID=1805714 RepID=A0AAU8A6B7_9FIRM
MSAAQPCKQGPPDEPSERGSFGGEDDAPEKWSFLHLQEAERQRRRRTR